MKKYIVPVLFICQSVAYAQNTDHSTEYAGTITAAELKEHVMYLAGPECEGRETGEKGQKVAAKYLAGFFEDLGIPPVTENYFQVFPLEGEAGCSSWVSINDVMLTADKDYVAYCGFSDGVSRAPAGSVYFAGYGIDSERYSDYKSGEVKGKWLIVLDGEPTVNGKSLINPSSVSTNWTTAVQQKIVTAMRHGAGGLMIVTDGDITKKYDTDHFTALESKFNWTHIPYMYISREVFEKHLGQSGYTSVDDIRKEIETKRKPVGFPLNSWSVQSQLGIKGEPKTGENVLAYIEGSDLKNEIVVITAHYDHLGVHDGETYYGADDDGSGTATIMEIAEAFMEAKKNGHGPRRSILVMPVSGEEKGLLGSEYYSEHPVFPLKQTVADLNIDMIGRIDDKHKDGNYVYLIGSDKLSTDLHKISEVVNSKYGKLTLDYTYNDPDDPNMFYYRSDHYNFAKHNIPVIFYFTGVHEDYHKPTDTPDKLDYNKTEKIARLVFHTAWELANRNERIKVDKENTFKSWR